MEKLKPPSYEETIAAGPSPSSARINMAYMPEGVFQHLPTAPTVGVIESVGAPVLSLVPLTDPELRAALYQHMKDFCCEGSKFIRDMTLTDIQNDCAFHYKLESFGEKRDCTPRFTGYYGQSIDGPENGAAPDKWNVPIGTPIKFVDHQITTEVPHTAYVKECATCEGEKRIDCTSCWARGRVTCCRCAGRGKDAEGFDCWICRGSGNEEKTHVDEIVSNRYNLPEELILEVSGQEIFTKQANQVEPLNTAHVTLNEASAVLIEKHHSSIKNEAILAQLREETQLLAHREAIRRPGVLSDGVIFLHENTHSARKTQELLQKFKWDAWSHSPYSPDSAPNLGSWK
ncbi:Protein SSUH2 [Araneus ventricosus]|uniref:Protein SSUH2 n=1 Tax=Araneus ventricosus TaxID=182803 RepID=A0A4Y2CTM8_ARAVE|nr:Protein SSUH2 [Araneus ventricosus]